MRHLLIPLLMLSLFVSPAAVSIHAQEKTPQSKKSAAVAPVPRPQPVKPPTKDELENSIVRGVDFLLKRQNRNGSWGSATRTKGLNIYAPVPGAHHAFRAAVTSLCVSALIETGDSRSEVRESLDRAQTWLIENAPRVRRAEPDAIYNVWAHAYSISALVRLRQRASDDEGLRKKLGGLVDQQIDLLRRYETVQGGWAYYDFTQHTQRPGTQSNSFTTATGIIALHEAKQDGFEVPERIVKRGLNVLRRQRKPDFSYLYGSNFKFYPMSSINRPGGSLGRSQACNLASRVWGDEAVTDQVLIDWLDRLFARNLWLDMGRKRPIPHESYFAVAGYFFYYGHFYGAACIEQLPEEMRPRYQALMARLLMPLQEKDGSWWDYPLYDYHQPYGTSFAIMSLVRCRADEETAVEKP